MLPHSSPVAVLAPAPAVQPSPRRIAPPALLSPELMERGSPRPVLDGTLFGSPVATAVFRAPESPPAARPSAAPSTPEATATFGTPMSVPATPVSARAVPAVPAAPIAADPTPAPVELHQEEFTSAHVKKDPYRASVAPDSKILKVTAAKIKEEGSDEIEKQHRKVALALEVFLMTYLAGSGKGQKPVLVANGSDPELVALYCAFVKMFHDAGLESTFTNARSDVTDELIANAKKNIEECFDASTAAGMVRGGLDKAVVDRIMCLYLIGRASDEAQYTAYINNKMGWGSTTPEWIAQDSLFRGRHAEAINQRAEDLNPVLNQSLSKIHSKIAETTAIESAGTNLVDELERTLIEANESSKPSAPSARA